MPKNILTTAKEKKILEVAKYIVENKATKEMVAEKFNISKSSIKNYINGKDNLQKINYELYLLVKNTQEELMQKTSNITDFEIEEIARVMLENDFTLKEASDFFQIATSTLHDRLKSINDEQLKQELDELFKYNKKAAEFQKN